MKTTTPILVGQLRHRQPTLESNERWKRDRAMERHEISPFGQDDREVEAFVGMWKERSDMTDNTAWVKNLRQKEWG